MKKRPEKIKLGIATTIKAASAKTKLPLGTIKSIQASGSKAFKANGRIDCDLLLDDVAKQPSTVADYYVEQALDMRAKRMLHEQKLKETSGLLIPLEMVRREWMRNWIALKTKLYDAEQTIATEAGMKLSLHPDGITALTEIIKKHWRPALLEMHKGELGKVECPECKTHIHPNSQK